MKWSRSMLLPAVLLALLLAACGGSTASSGGNGGNGGDESQAAESQAAESEAAEPTPEESEDNGGNGGNGGPTDDLDQLAEDLTPPNATETSRTEAGGVIFLTWEVSDAPEDVASWFEDALDDVGLDVFSRTTSGGAFSYIFGIEEGSNFGGVMSIAPSGTGSGSGVGLQIGTSE